MHLKSICLGLLVLLLSQTMFSQDIEFKLIDAIKTQELSIDKNLNSEQLLEVDVLPEDKRFLVITAEVMYTGDKSLRLEKDEVSIGPEKYKAIGYLKDNKRADLKWGFKGNIWEGKNYFSAIFIIDAQRTHTTLHIKDRTFAIEDIKESSIAKPCSPKVSVLGYKYTDEISFVDNYRRGENQSYIRKVTPTRGKFVEVSLSLDFCENPEYFKKKSFRFEPGVFQLRNKNGVLFDCVGTHSFGKFERPTTFNVMGYKNLQKEVTLVFNVPKEGDYNILYLGDEVSRF